jgi:CYTH domain-containing protein
MRDQRGFYDPDIAPVEYIFTYKHDLQDQPGCLEIETPISEGDFQLAWSDATHKIHKTRYLLKEDGRVWEVDLFKDRDGAYLAMAELEVDQNSGPPQTLHPLIQAFLLHRVDESDRRFKNRNLCLREPVEKLLKEIV